MSLLQVNNLHVTFDTPDGTVQAVNGIGFDMQSGQTLGVVGESGSGKSQTVLAIIGLLSDNGSATGSVRFKNEEILNLPAARLNALRGEEISMIFQDPMTSLNPYLTIARQMTEVLEFHYGMTRKTARAKAIDMLDAVRIPAASARIDRYPHEFSGGMCQRIVIAMSLLCKPDLLIADEPTTALDVTVQAQIIELLREIKTEFDTSIILITHDLGVVAGICDHIIVMYGGQVMEYGTDEDIFYRAKHPYTAGLLRSVPRLDETEHARLQTIPGNPPNMIELPQGCPFYARCEYRLDVCETQRPKRTVVNDEHAKACHLEQWP